MLQELTGRSLVPLLKNPQADLPDRPAFTQIRRNSIGSQKLDTSLMGYSVRTSDWRYNEWWTIEQEPQLRGAELYDLHADPSEENNCADDPYKQAVRQRLSRLIADYR